MPKILVVDDEADLEALIKQKFRKQIREREYEFFFALNGKEALLRLNEEQDIDMLFSDINMPEMDGLMLLEKVNELRPIIKTVMVSAYGDMDNIRSAMNKGAFDFLCKPVNFEPAFVYGCIHHYNCMSGETATDDHIAGHYLAKAFNPV